MEAGDGRVVREDTADAFSCAGSTEGDDEADVSNIPPPAPAPAPPSVPIVGDGLFEATASGGTREAALAAAAY